MRVPVTMLWGDDDRLLSLAYARSAAARIPGASLELLPDCGHVPQRECPGPLLARLRESLARVPARPPTGRRVNVARKPVREPWLPLRPKYHAAPGPPRRRCSPARRALPKVRMNQEARSERSRAQILDAALEAVLDGGLSRHQHARHRAEAGVSTGNVYHQFPDKESLFRTLLDQYWAALASTEFPFIQALAPARSRTTSRRSRALHATASISIAATSRSSTSTSSSSTATTSASSTRTWRAGSRRSWRSTANASRSTSSATGVPPLAAIMVASRFFLQYFAVEILFGVPNHFGRDTETRSRTSSTS